MSVAGGRIAAGVGANLIGQHAQDRNQDATVYVGNLDPQVRWVIAFLHRELVCMGAAHTAAMPVFALSSWLFQTCGSCSVCSAQLRCLSHVGTVRCR